MRKLKFPEAFKEIKLNRKLSILEMQKVMKGKEPNHMDDKWIVYFQDSWLYFHRFLTGNCIYKVHIKCQELICEINKVLVNGDSDQYDFDELNELAFFEELFDLFINSKI
jgi:hypothetical protein